MAIFAPISVVLKDGTPAIVRSPEPNDEESQVLLDLFRTVAAEEEYILTAPTEARFTVEDEKMFVDSVRNHPNRLHLVLEISGRVVGLLGIDGGSRQREQHIGTMGMMLHPDARGNGGERALLDALLSWVRQHPVLRRVVLAAFSHNERAIRLYRSVGFVAEGYRVKQYRFSEERFVDEVLMGLWVDFVSAHTENQTEVL